MLLLALLLLQGVVAFISPSTGHLKLASCIINKSNLQKTIQKQNILPTFATTMDEIETGPLLSAGKREAVQKFVQKMGGKRPIQRILIANNGMAATKAILSMRQWAYITLGDENALEFVALATRDDLNANADFIRLADTFVEVPSGSNKVSVALYNHYNLAPYV